MMITYKQIINRKPIKDVKHLIKTRHKKEITNVIDWLNDINAGPGNIKSVLLLLSKMILHDVYSRWRQRITISRTIYKSNASSLRANRLRFGFRVGKILYDEANKKRITNKLDILIERYGKEEALKRKKTYLKKWKASIKKKKDSGTWNNGISLESWKKRLGDEKGYEEWKRKRDTMTYRFSIGWYKENYPVTWKEEWDKYCKGMADRAPSISKNNKFVGYSKISQKLFWSIYNNLPEELKKLCYFAELNKEYRFNITEDWGYYTHADFVLKDKIIEFDGAYWHSFKEKKARDSKITLFYKKLGYKVLRISDNEYKKYPEEVRFKCMEFLND